LPKAKERTIFIFSPTWKCGQNCSYCDYRTEDINDKSYKLKCFGEEHIINGEYPWAYWMVVLDRFRPYHIEFTGGEPTLYDGFEQLLTYIPRDCSWAVTSNTLNTEVLETLSPSGSKGWTASYHFRQHDKFIKNYLLLRRKGFLVSVTLVLTPENHKEVEKVARDMTSKNIIVNIHPILQQGHDWYKHNEIYEHFKKLKAELCQNGGTYRFVPIAKRWTSDGAVDACPAGTNYFVLWGDGRVFRCYLDAIKGIDMGKIETLEPHRLEYPCDGGCIFPCDKECQSREWKTK